MSEGFLFCDAPSDIQPCAVIFKGKDDWPLYVPYLHCGGCKYYGCATILAPCQYCKRRGADFYEEVE